MKINIIQRIRYCYSYYIIMGIYAKSNVIEDFIEFLLIELNTMKIMYWLYVLVDTLAILDHYLSMSSHWLQGNGIDTKHAKLFSKHNKSFIVFGHQRTSF